MRFDVISIGSATLDVFLESKELKLLKTPKVFTGRALIAPYGAKSEVSRLLIQSGGGGTNTAVGFSRLGLRAGVLARCGRDLAGQIVRTQLRQEGVSRNLLIQVKGDETDYSTILQGPDGGRSILVYRGGTRLEIDLIDFSKLKASWFYISSLEGNLAFLKKVLDHAGRYGIQTAINPGRKELAQRKELIPLLNRAEVVIINQEEAARLTGLEMTDKRLLPKTCALVKEVGVVTQAQKGAQLFTRDDQWLTTPAFKIKAKDTTGAGDGFGVGFVAGLMMGWPLSKALKLGVANGASVVTKMGAKTGLLTLREAQKWIKRPIGKS
ncbi:MAG: carbohydrate kinase family protein [Candidatus Pacebacteria bacterium]|nr:carbohydrate kinase family protein [Candidatus Paceibacterota bacterium]